MKVIETKVYSFSELSKEAQETAIENHYNINTDYEWWEFVYEDAKQLYLEITEFDLHRGRSCRIKFEYQAKDTAIEIIEKHGEKSETYKTAKHFLSELEKLTAKYSDGIDLETVELDKEYDFELDLEEIEDEFKLSLENDYASMLQENYDYFTSEETIRETLKESEYDFLENGKVF